MFVLRKSSRKYMELMQRFSNFSKKCYSVLFYQVGLDFFTEIDSIDCYTGYFCVRINLVQV